DAEIGGKAAQGDFPDPSLPQVTRQPGRRAVVVLEEGGIAVDIVTESFPDHEFCLGPGQSGMKVRADAALDAMVRPQRLRAIRHVNALKSLLAGMAGGKAGVSGRMPVLCHDHMVEIADQVVDQRNDLVPAFHCQGSTGTEVVLQVNHDQGLFAHLSFPFRCGRGGSRRRNLTRWPPASTLSARRLPESPL